MVKANKNPTTDFDAEGARKVLLGIGLLGAGLLAAAAVGFVIVRKRERSEEPYNDFYAFLGVGA